MDREHKNVLCVRAKVSGKQKLVEREKMWNALLAKERKFNPVGFVTVQERT